MLRVNRRSFLTCMAGLGLTMVLPPAKSSTNPQALHRTIPGSGERIPAIGLGTWLVFGIDPDDQEELAAREQILREFLIRGGGVLDSSPMYGSAQEVIGKCLRRIGHRRGLFSATKVWVKGARQGYLQMEHSRVLWGLQNLDLMQVHNLLDWKVHLPVLQAMKEEGKIRYVGVTTSHGRRHDLLINIMRTQQLDFVQFTYNLLDREAEQYLLPLAEDRGIAVIVNRPFQRGGLFDHVARTRLPEWAKEIGCDNWAHFFLKFIISHSAVTCTIPATSKVAHLRENMAAAYGILPDQAVRKKMISFIESI